MTGVDWIIVGLVLVMALFGWAQGFVAGALSLAGFAGGAWLGTRLAPLVLPDGSESPYAPVFALFGAVAAGAILATGFEGVGAALRARMRSPGMAAADGVLGAALTGCVALALSWVAGAIALQTPGARELRREVQRSAILTRLNDVLPSRDLLNALARFDPLPQITGPGVDVAPPRAAIARDPDVRAASASVVKVIGEACGLGVQGSGWVAPGGLVVTNAHVVAGVESPEVLAGGEGHAARAVHFDARNDVAVLRAEGLGAPALAFGPAEPGRQGAVAGFPENGGLDLRPARIGSTSTVLTQDAYGRGPVRRSITGLRGLVRSGNSGGPVIDGRGRVLTTVFAATTRGARGGYGVPNAIVRDALAAARGPVSTGPCTG